MHWIATWPSKPMCEGSIPSGGKMDDWEIDWDCDDAPEWEDREQNEFIDELE